MVRTVSAAERKPICILADLQGPKIRTGKLKDHKPVQLVAGERFTITPREIAGHGRRWWAPPSRRWRRTSSPARAFCSRMA